MKFYHGTSKENWDAIQQEGVLFGRRGNTASRCTYLAKDKEEAEQYGDIVLEVEYNPLEHPDNNNYCSGCWQFRVYEPIPLKHLRVINTTSSGNP